MSLSRPKHRFDSAGVPIAFFDEGAGPPVLLIHGFASNADTNWVGPGLVEALVRAGRRAIALDNRGHGDSGRPYDPAAYSLAVMAEDARRLLDHLGVAAADAMGYSMGARIAATLALAHPGRVRALLLGGVGETLITGSWRSEGGLAAVLAGLRAPDPATVVNPVAQQFRAFADRVGGDRKALAACAEGLAGSRIEPARLKGLRMPIQIVIGSDDLIAGPSGPLAEALPHAELAIVPGRDHMKTVGDRRYREAVLAFLDRLDRRG